MATRLRCDRCGEPFDDDESMADHLVRAHDVSESAAWHELDRDRPLVPRCRSESDDDRLVRVAIANLNRARSHAQTLHGLAKLIMVLGLFIALGTFVAAASNENSALAAVAATSIILVCAVFWAVLKALSLHLHLTVDRAMLDGVD